MGGVTLVAVEKDGRLTWEPVGGIESAASREAQRRAEREEARWASEKQEALSAARLAEAKEVERREKQRKAHLLGAENVYRTQRVKGALLPVPPLLRDTRAEEKAARKAGMPCSAPKQYQFIKESLDALERSYAAQEQAARQAQYERNRSRLKLHSKGWDAEVGEEEESEEEEDLRSRLAKMSEDEFRALALVRKERADMEVAAGAAASAAAVAPASSRPPSARPRKQKMLDPYDDPDYRR